MTGDDAFFVLGNHPRRDPGASASDALRMPFVGFDVQFQTHLHQVPTHPRAKRYRVFADATGEHHSVQLWQDRDRAAQVALDPVGKDVDRLWRVAGPKSIQSAPWRR